MSQYCGHEREHLSQYITQLTSSLTTPCSPTKAPDFFDRNLEAAINESGSNFQKILLRAKFQVWFAYFLASQRGTVSGLDCLQPTELEFVTAQIANISPHHTVQQLFSHLLDGDDQRKKKRRSLLNSINVNIAEKPSSPNERPSKRARISYQDLGTYLSGGPMVNTDPSQRSATDTYNTDHGDQGAAASQFHAIYGLIGFDVDPRIQVAWPTASYLGFVFPAYLTSVIVKTDGKTAWLKASFPVDFTKCELEFFISPSAIQHVAKELFDIHIATRGQQRGILLDNDVFVEVDGSLTLTGSPLAKVEKLLGALATEAYQISRSRSDEVDNGQTGKTHCLSMQLWPELDCPSRLRLKVEVGKLSSMTERLWPTAAGVPSGI
ncbi:hypothetical protein CSUB01_10715 [Colletotrichum sublineola]|uniref:Uncharacterized protein n=1 Tax=Colletotrichum sublineola TaxID=1173701 RepID=A0A066X1X3_COLSU|nr:hypothetical protein CSUB01_10715 [Colletotrichum sublineola]